MLPRRKSRDLPLDRDASVRFLPWLVGFMVYLAALALAAALATGNLVSRWDDALRQEMTVQIPPPAESDRTDDTLEARVAAAVELLSNAPGVGRVEPLDDSEMRALVEPWLGAEADTLELPLPALISLTPSGEGWPDVETLEAALQNVAPGAAVDDHQGWLVELRDAGRSMQLLAVLVLALVGASAVSAVVFVTRTGLAVHRQVIELLHLIGAQDRYVARQFQAHALRLGFFGGLLGVVLAIASILGLGALVLPRGEGLLPELRLSLTQLALLGLLPPAAGLIAMLTARLTVLRTLARFN